MYQYRVKFWDTGSFDAWEGGLRAVAAMAAGARGWWQPFALFGGSECVALVPAELSRDFAPTLSYRILAQSFDCSKTSGSLGEELSPLFFGARLAVLSIKGDQAPQKEVASGRANTWIKRDGFAWSYS